MCGNRGWYRLTYEELLIEADSSGIKVRELPIQSGDGRCMGNRIAIRNSLTSVKKADVLAEELEHYYVNVGNILDQNNVDSRKQERTARLRAYNRRIGLTGIVDGYKAHCRSRYELAEFLGVSEETLAEALELYREKYGCYVEIDNYIVMFEPSLAVMEKI